MTQLNEDNIRVIFERFLSPGLLSSKNSFEIWNRFLEFELSTGCFHANYAKVGRAWNSNFENFALNRLGILSTKGFFK